MTPLMRRIEVDCLAPNGDVSEAGRLVPAVPAFDQITSAFARGSLIATERGMVAIEDLWPGDVVRTVGGGSAPLLWRGSTMIIPEARGQDRLMDRLTQMGFDERSAREAILEMPPTFELEGGELAPLYRAPEPVTLTLQERPDVSGLSAAAQDAVRMAEAEGGTVLAAWSQVTNQREGRSSPRIA